MMLKGYLSAICISVCLSYATLSTNNPNGTNCLPELIGGQDPDSLWWAGIPYFDFRNYFDSCYVHCRYGEVRILHPDGSVDGVNPFYFLIGGGPICFDNYQGLQDSSRTEYFTLNVGDTLRYYKDLNIVAKYTSTEYLGLNDTLMFITQLLDSASGDWVKTLDTAAVIISDSLKNCQYYYNHTGWATADHSWSFPVTEEFQYGKISLGMRVEYRYSQDSLDVLCRWDELSSSYHSKLDEYSFAQWAWVVDSMLNSGLGRTRHGFQPAAAFKLNVWPNPIQGEVLHISFESAYPARCSLYIYNTLGAIIWRSTQYSLKGGQRIYTTLDISHFTPGSYYLVPILDGVIGIGREFNIVK